MAATQRGARDWAETLPGTPQRLVVHLSPTRAAALFNRTRLPSNGGWGAGQDDA